MKKCNQCKVEKPISEFGIDNTRKDKLQAKCKTCVKEIVTKHTKTNQYKHQREWNEKRRAEGYFKQYAEGGYWNNYQKQRRAADPYYSLYINLRSRISNLLTGKTKSKRTQQIIGLTIDEFKIHLEGMWVEGMSWGNYGYGEGKWVLDHRKPIASAQSKADIIALNHYTNLQPMWWMENLIKRDRSE